MDRATMVGLIFWTLPSYALHRIGVARMPYFSAHARCTSLAVSAHRHPSWISVVVLQRHDLVPHGVLGVQCRDGLTVGVMLGYWWYGVVHHVMPSSRDTSSPAYFNDLSRLAHAPHYSPRNGNFGVTTRCGIMSSHRPSAFAKGSRVVLSVARPRRPPSVRWAPR